MKKCLMFTALFALSVKAFCSPDYDIYVEDHPKSFTLNITTLEDRSSMGELVATQLYIERPQQNSPGFIAMSLELNPDAVHLPAFGAQKAEIFFQKGKNLPALIDGEYLLEIDGESYGSLLFEKGQIYYYQLENEE